MTTAPQLKVLQEIVTMCVFAGFTAWCFFCEVL